ncbi:MAG: ThuA domain-containing protein, partial [Saprospiraceae bacterium]
RGYGPPESGVDVSIIPEAASHPIIKDIQTSQWHGEGSIYQVAPLLDKEATVLLIGKINDKTEPVAWTRTAGKSRIFYTSLGYPTDFQTSQFNTLLVNAIKWTLIKN